MHPSDIELFTNPTKGLKSNRLGSALRTLMSARGYNGKTLAPEIGISETSLSKILKGHTQPRKQTFKKLRKKLSETDTEREYLTLTYEHPLAASLTLDGFPKDRKKQVAHTRIRLEYAERARLVQLKQDVRKILQASEIPFNIDYIFGDCVADFQFELNFHDLDRELGIEVPMERRFVLICKSDPDLKHDRELSWFLQDSLLADEVVFIVPHKEGSPHRFAPRAARGAGLHNEILTTKGLPHYLQELKEAAV